MSTNLLSEAYTRSLEHRTRRHFLRGCSTGLGAMWLSSMMGKNAFAADKTISHPGFGPHFSPKAKRVIFLHMIGGPSQLELFDYKPDLGRLDGKDCPQEFLEGQRFAFIQGVPKILGHQCSFKQHGQSGAYVSNHLPHFSKMVDEVAFIKTMQTDQFNHGPAQMMVHSGQPRVGYPSIGSWVTWGLGSENQNLPGFVVLLSGGRQPRAGKALWTSGFLPSTYQGVQCRSKGEPVLNVTNPSGISREMRRSALDTLKTLNQKNHEAFGDPETLTRISQYEMAFRMQMAVPEAMDLNSETKQTKEMYGVSPGEESFANNCLLARKLAERGVRFIQLFDWGWDTHGSSERESLTSGFLKKCKAMDRPVAALLKDLKQRGLLEDTLVIWGGEFGRTPMQEKRDGTKGNPVGRDHNPNAFTYWMAGAGVKPGITYGETDALGYFAQKDPVHLRDFHATVQHLMGINPKQLTYPYQGLNQKLTGVKESRVIQEILS